MDAQTDKKNVFKTDKLKPGFHTEWGGGGGGGGGALGFKEF